MRHTCFALLLTLSACSSLSSGNRSNQTATEPDEPIEITVAPIGANAPQSNNADLNETGESLQTAATPEETTPIFTLVDTGLKHKLSGIVCPPGTNGFQLAGEESYQGLPRGQDVACVYEASMGGSVKLHMTNFGRAVSASAHLKGVNTTITDKFKTTGTRPVPRGPFPETATEAASAYGLSAVSDLRPDVPVETATWIEAFDVWHVKVRATYEADRSDAVALLVADLYASVRETIAPLPDAPIPPAG